MTEPKMNIGNYADLRKKLFNKKQLAKLDGQIAAELEEMDLREIRSLVGVSQSELAKAMEVAQSAISHMEKRPDHYVSSLRRVIEALGGELELVARFEHRSVRLR